MKFSHLLFAGVICATLTATVSAQEKDNRILVQANKPYTAVAPTMWGVFFEDINMGADGGIYAELIKNRSFEFYKPLMGWEVKQSPFKEGAVTVINRQDVKSNNPRFARVKVKGNSREQLSMTNEGFRGMGIRQGLRYFFSVWYRTTVPGIKMHVELLSQQGDIVGTSVLSASGTSGTWNKMSTEFLSSITDSKGRFRIWFEGDGDIDIDMVSLFPEDTWKKRPGGLRADMVQLLADLKPGFLRFPGGCIVEGYDLSQRYQWKKTIGPVEERELIISRWNFEFSHRPTPDYFQTFGLGFFEYFQLAEDIGASPLPILNCGMACQFNTAELVPMDQLDPYIQDAMDLIEFANGDVSTKWGKVRSDMGHPASFNLKMLGIGNENWGPQYIERLDIFRKAIKARYPDIQLVTSAGTDPSGERFDYLNTELRKMKADVIDEHYYRRPEWFFENAGRYDQYDRNSSKIFAGEYAGQSDKTVSIHNHNNVRTAIGEAAFLTGLERNADVVVMASYAPLFAHIDGWQWTPDLIWVDNLRSMGTVNYQVQKLFSTNRGTHAVPALLKGKALSGQDSLYVSAVVDKDQQQLIIKIVNSSMSARKIPFLLEGYKKPVYEGQITELSGQPDQMNTLDQPGTILPVQSVYSGKGNKMDIAVKPFSLTVIRVTIK